MSQTKASIVFVHGIWPDASCFGKGNPNLREEGYEVFASRRSLGTLGGDVGYVRPRVRK